MGDVVEVGVWLLVIMLRCIGFMDEWGRCFCGDLRGLWFFFEKGNALLGLLAGKVLFLSYIGIFSV